MTDVRRLPLPVTETWDWQMHGSCRDMSSEVFFHPEGERGPLRADRDSRAKQVCRGCPVLERCRDHALAVHEPYGVWGGMTESERREHLHADAAGTVVIDVDFGPGQHGASQAPTSGPWPAA